ncbi:MAG: thiol-disulfide isomerase [Acidobacteria bacterium]|nr:thiol-disulfide isomerase [Acidobacteriota bacterium]
MAPFPLVTYQDARPWARLIAESVSARTMPPWFADTCCGHFSNDLSLNQQELTTIANWVGSGAPPGNPQDAPPDPHWTKGWNIPPPDLVVKMPRAVNIPAAGEVEYSYEIVPTNFPDGKWIQASELRPSARDHVHHAVVYVRPPESSWLRDAPVGVPFTASTLHDPHLMHEAHSTTSDLLLVYAPGSSPENWPTGTAKYIPAHSDLVFQLHYTTNGHATEDQTSLGLVFIKGEPKQRVLTLQLANDHDIIPIPPNTDNYRVEVEGTLPNNCLLLGFFPHMHLRGKRFEYDIVHDDGTQETLLRVNYHFYWQLSYRLTVPRMLAGGTKLRAIAWYDNSRRNAHNPNPDAAVQWGDQTYNEMMVGFFDIAVSPAIGKEQFFVRRRAGEK